MQIFVPLPSLFPFTFCLFTYYFRPVTEETQAPGQPTAVRTMTSSDSAVVSWLPPDDNTLVRTYMIGYGEGVPDVKWIYVNGSQRNVTIYNLSKYTIGVIYGEGTRRTRAPLFGLGYLTPHFSG